MRAFFVRLLNMLIGLVFYALGIVVTMQANVGYAPWEVFHAGLSGTIALSIGLISIIVGVVIVIIVTAMGEKLGLGTISNMLLIGIFVDIILIIDIIPQMESFIYGSMMLIVGLFTISIGSYFYIGSGFGAGPRDNLMVVLARKTKIPVGVCRSLIELTVTISGWFLGGMVGAGTVITVIGIGFCVQTTFKILKFDVTAIKHESLSDTFAFLTAKRNSGNENI